MESNDNDNIEYIKQIEQIEQKIINLLKDEINNDFNDDIELELDDQIKFLENQKKQFENNKKTLENGEAREKIQEYGIAINRKNILIKQLENVGLTIRNKEEYKISMSPELIREYKELQFTFPDAKNPNSNYV